MKKVLIVFIILTVVAAGVLLYAVSRADSIIEAYKPELERLASESLGAKVTLGELSVSVFPSARVVVDSAQVSNPENAEERIDVAQVELDIELIPLLSGNVAINTLRISDPTITVLMEEDGFFVQGLPRETEAAESSEAATAITSEEMVISVDLESFVLENATVLIKDTIAKTDYTLTGLNMKASFSFANDQARFTQVKGDGVFMETISLKYTADALQYGLTDGVMGLEKLAATTMGSTIYATGELSPDDAKKEITITSDGVDLVGLDPALTLFAPTAKEFGIKGSVKPNLVFALTPTGYRTSGTLGVTSFGAAIEGLIGIDAITGTYQVEVNEVKQRFASEKLAGTMNKAPFTVNMVAALNEKDGTLKPFDVQAFGGTIAMTTSLQKNDETYPFESTLRATNLKIEELIPAFAPDMPFAITGTVENANGKINGNLTEDLMPSIKGNAKGKIVEGLIHDLNLGQQVLASVKGLPFLRGALLDSAPSELNRFLDAKDTTLSEVSGSFDIKDEKAYSENIKVVSDFFELNAKGSIGFDTNLDLDSVIYFSPAFSAELADEVKELEVLLDSSGRLAFPVKITGIAPDLSTVPDTSSMLKGAVGNTVRKEMKKKVKDLLNINDEAPAEAPADGTEPPEESKPSAEDTLVDSIESGIKGLFGGKKKD